MAMFHVGQKMKRGHHEEAPSRAEQTEDKKPRVDEAILSACVAALFRSVRVTCAKFDQQISFEGAALIVGYSLTAVQRFANACPRIDGGAVMGRETVATALNAVLTADLFQYYTDKTNAEVWWQEDNKKAYVKSKIVALYHQHHVAKVGDVDDILLKYKGNEKTLFANLRHKYGNDALEPYDELVVPAVPNGIGEHVRGSFVHPVGHWQLEMDPFRAWIRQVWGNLDDGACVFLAMALEHLVSEVMELSVLARRDVGAVVVHYTHIVRGVADDSEVAAVLGGEPMEALVHAAKAFADVDRGERILVDAEFPGPITRGYAKRCLDAVVRMDGAALAEYVQYPGAKAIQSMEDAMDADTAAAKTGIAATLPTLFLRALFSTCLSCAAGVRFVKENDAKGDNNHIPLDEFVRNLWNEFNFRVQRLDDEDAHLGRLDARLSSARQVADAIPLLPCGSPTSFSPDLLTVLLASTEDWYKKRLIKSNDTPDCVALVERLCAAGAKVEGDTLLYAGPLTASVLLSQGADPLH
jgi:hypothetical protein